MFKQRLTVLIATGAIAIATPFVAAQDSPSNDQAPPSAMQGPGGGGWQHHPMDPAKRTAELTKRLKLTSDQQTKVQDILTTEKTQMESLHQDTSTAPQDRRAKMMDIRQTSNTQIRALLDAGQQKKWDEMQARHEQMMENHRGGPPAGSDQPAPPPQ
jgi:protein CpxP